MYKKIKTSNKEIIKRNKLYIFELIQLVLLCKCCNNYNKLLNK